MERKEYRTWFRRLYIACYLLTEGDKASLEDFVATLKRQELGIPADAAPFDTMESAAEAIQSIALMPDDKLVPGCASMVREMERLSMRTGSTRRSPPDAPIVEPQSVETQAWHNSQKVKRLKELYSMHPEDALRPFGGLVMRQDEEVLREFGGVVAPGTTPQLTPAPANGMFVGIQGPVTPASPSLWSAAAAAAVGTLDDTFRRDPSNLGPRNFAVYDTRASPFLSENARERRVASVVCVHCFGTCSMPECSTCGRAWCQNCRARAHFCNNLLAGDATGKYGDLPRACDYTAWAERACRKLDGGMYQGMVPRMMIWIRNMRHISLGRMPLPRTIDEALAEGRDRGDNPHDGPGMRQFCYHVVDRVLQQTRNAAGDEERRQLSQQQLQDVQAMHFGSLRAEDYFDAPRARGTGSNVIVMEEAAHVDPTLFLTAILPVRLQESSALHVDDDGGVD
jgi:hypothetical protein